MSEASLATVRWADAVYGPTGPAVDDLAELYHEASSAYPSFAARQARGVRLLADSAPLRITATRAVKRHGQVPRIRLPVANVPSVPFSRLVGGRRSQREFRDGGLDLSRLATILHAGYGVTRPGDQPLRSVPSGGALYPLDLYVLAARVLGLEAGLYHFDPLERELEALAVNLPSEPFVEAMIFPDPAEQAAVAIVIAAMFWRTRFKYGLRGYRFALLEAGHVAQNLLLAAEALDLCAVPLGGFYDRRLADFLSLDGVNEAPLYIVCIGHPA